MEGVGRHPQEGGLEMIQEIITKEAWEVIDHECGRRIGCHGCTFANAHEECTINIMCDKVRLLDKKREADGWR